MDEIEYNNPTWHKVAKWAEAELARARLRNDAVALSDDETKANRGEIRAFKRLLDLPNVAARKVVSEPGE